MPDVLLALHDAIPAMAAAERNKAKDKTWQKIAAAYPARIPDHELGAEQRSWDWHERRALSIEVLEGDVLDCEQGDRTTKLKCLDCGQDIIVPYRCERPFLCHTCRKTEQRSRRKRVVRQLLAAHRSSEVWGERMLTLTMPHVGNSEERIKLSLEAPRLFERWLRRYLGTELAAFWASWELTGGDDDEGHPHWHYLLAAAYVPQPLVAARWAVDLMRCGGPKVAEAMHSKPARELFDWIDSHVFHAEKRAKAWTELARFIRVPWYCGALKPPRRHKNETTAAYVERRSAWAEERTWLAGVPSGTETLRNIVHAEPYWCWTRAEVHAALRTSRVPTAIVDARHDLHKPVLELVKYAIKDDGQDKVTPHLHAVAYIATRGRRLFRSSVRKGAEKKVGHGCPACHSKRIRKDVLRPEIKHDFWAFVRKIRRELHACHHHAVAVRGTQLRLRC